MTLPLPGWSHVLGSLWLTTPSLYQWNFQQCEMYYSELWPISWKLKDDTGFCFSKLGTCMPCLK